MENLTTPKRNFKLLNRDKIKLALYAFSKNEWRVFLVLLLALLVSTLMILQGINKSFMVKVPMEGGSISEGLLGSPRFVNPVLAFSDTDRDIASLVYSGLMRKDPNGKFVPDLAENYTVSEDGLTYTFTLKDGLTFQDGASLTANDVLFTMEQIADPIIKSPRRGNWEGVSIEKTDDKTIVFTLKKPYASFLENTTLGILPAHIWKDTPIELNEANIKPTGSGPYKIEKVSKDSEGLVKVYELSSFKNFALGKPYIKKIYLKFYQTEDELIKALEGNSVDQISSISPENAIVLSGKNTIESSTLPRVFGLFFNQNQNQIFTDKNVIKAIDLAVNKDRIIEEVLSGYGVAIEDPIPANLVSYQRLLPASDETQLEKVEEAKDILGKDGWTKNEEGYLEKTITGADKKKSVTTLEFSIYTGNAKELSRTADLIKQDLENIGFKVDVKTFEVGNLNQLVIRPRKYDALLFGQIINSETDLFAFWHSSQRKDPGLNVAMYTNAKVDKLLEDAFMTLNEQDRVKKYAEFEEEVKKDMPAVFLYSPNFIYAISKDLKGFSLDHITSPRDRFLNVYLWYTKTDNVWKVFSK